MNGQKILKAYQNPTSLIVWILGNNNSVYRLNTANQQIEDLSNLFSAFGQYHFIDIASPDDQQLFLATDATIVVQLNGSTTTTIGPANGLMGNVNSIGLYLPNSYYYNGGNSRLRIGTSGGWALYDLSTGVLNFNPDVQSGNIFEENFRAGIFINSGGHNSEGPDAAPIDIYTYSIANPSVVVAGYIWQNGVYGHPTTAFYSFPNLYFDYGIDNYYMALFWGSENGLFENQFVQSL